MNIIEYYIEFDLGEREHEINRAKYIMKIRVSKNIRYFVK